MSSPRKEKKREIIAVRFTESRRDEIKEHCENNEMNYSDYFNLLVDKDLRAKNVKALRELG